MKTTIVSKDTFPLLFAAWMMIRHDNGMVNRYEPADERFQTAELPETLQVAEAELSALNAVDFETFCIGEESEKDALLYKYSLETSDYVLNVWFG